MWLHHSAFTTCKRLVAGRPEFEIDCLLDVPDRTTWIGRRNHALLMLMVQTGIRLSEVTSLCRQNAVLSRPAYVRCIGKGRKERCTPLMKQIVEVLKAWLKENNFAQTDPLFPSTRGGPLSSDAVQHMLSKYIATARMKCPSLKGKRISPHVMRHTAAMQMRQAGIDRSMIALWLGHESVETTQIYLDADLSMKEKILEKMTPFQAPKGRYTADDKLLAFLNSI